MIQAVGNKIYIVQLELLSIYFNNVYFTFNLGTTSTTMFYSFKKFRPSWNLCQCQHHKMQHMEIGCAISEVIITKVALISASLHPIHT